MPFSIVTTSNARRDIFRAIEWEDSRKPNLGRYFFDQLVDKFNSLSVVPYMGSVRYENVRCTTTDVFEYIIHYIVDPELQRVVILRVLHAKREPEK